MLKYRAACVVLAVVCVIGLGITLYVPENPHIPAAYFFACTCIAALAGNAVVSVIELQQARKELRRKIEEERQADRQAQQKENRKKR